VEGDGRRSVAALPTRIADSGAASVPSLSPSGGLRVRVLGPPWARPSSGRALDCCVAIDGTSGQQRVVPARSDASFGTAAPAISSSRRPNCRRVRGCLWQRWRVGRAVGLPAL